MQAPCPFIRKHLCACFLTKETHRTDADTRLRIGAFGALVSLLFTVSFGGRAACGGPVPVRHDPRGHFPSVSLHPRRRLCPLAPVTWMLGKSGGRASAEACFPCWAESGVTTSSVSWWFPAAPLPDPSPFCLRVCRVSQSIAAAYLAAHTGPVAWRVLGARPYRAGSLPYCFSVQRGVPCSSGTFLALASAVSPRRPRSSSGRWCLETQTGPSCTSALLASHPR